MLLTDDICCQCPLPILTARLLTWKKGLHFPSRSETFFTSSSSSFCPQLLCIFSIYEMLWDHSGRKAPRSITTLACKANRKKWPVGHKQAVCKFVICYLCTGSYSGLQDVVVCFILMGTVARDSIPI